MWTSRTQGKGLQIRKEEIYWKVQLVSATGTQRGTMLGKEAWGPEDARTNLQRK